MQAGATANRRSRDCPMSCSGPRVKDCAFSLRLVLAVTRERAFGSSKSAQQLFSQIPNACDMYRLSSEVSLLQLACRPGSGRSERKSQETGRTAARTVRQAYPSARDDCRESLTHF